MSCMYRKRDECRVCIVRDECRVCIVRDECHVCIVKEMNVMYVL